MSDNPSPAAEVPYQLAAAPPLDARPEPSGGGGLLAMIERLATRQDLNIDVFERLLKARREEEDRVGERAFNAAMSLAKGELTPVLKTREVDFTSARTNTRTKYKYESFADVQKVVDPVFALHGLSYRFSVAQSAKQVKVTCIVSHSDGYSDNVALESDVDPGSTGMSMVQALGSALTYLQRYSLRAAIGLAAGVDDDGRSSGGASPMVTSEQVAELQYLIEETGRSPVTLLMLVGAVTMDTMTVDQWTRAKAALDLAIAEQKRRQNAPARD